ncbi:CD40 ligand [Python bivittatus]|uniref:CD40 ligand n=1 Tax=Python bivittatus TaxID=176946 RepID=A0A9F5IF32_PYTBI|nr:CD40 ligand [Python bivittatus]
MEEPREPYSPTNLRPVEPVPMVTMKTFLGVISLFVIAQLVGTVFYILHLHMKLDKMGSEMTLHEDFMFLKRVQNCRKPQEDDTTFLDCAKISDTFRDLLDLPKKVPDQRKPAMQTGDKKPSASIHLAGMNTRSKVLQWKNAVYAPKDDVFSNLDGKIKIGKGGRYYIYSQVAFCSKPELRAPFNVYVYLNLPSESDQLLLKGVGTYSSSEDLCGLQSIYVGRAVELQLGHTVFVNVTDYSRVNYDHGNTYFGIIQLS